MSRSARDVILARRAMFVASTLSAFVSAAASAQPDCDESNEHGPSEADQETARMLNEEAEVAFRHGDLEGALDRLIRAGKLQRVPAQQLRIGQVAALLGDHAKVAEVLARYDACLPEGPAEPDKHAHDSLVEHLAKLGRLRILVSGATTGEIIIDGDLRLSLPPPPVIYLSPGTHVLRIAVGDPVEERRVELVAGHEVTFTFQASPRVCLQPCLQPCLSIDPGYVNREPLTLGLSNGPVFYGALQGGDHGGGVSLTVFANVGSDDWEFRAGALGGVIITSPAPVIGLLGGALSARHNFVDAVGVSVSVSLGGLLSSQSTFFAAPEIGMPIIALGRFEIEPRLGLVLTPDDGAVYVTPSVLFGYVFYSDDWDEDWEETARF